MKYALKPISANIDNHNSQFAGFAQVFQKRPPRFCFYGGFSDVHTNQFCLLPSIIENHKHLRIQFGEAF